MNNISVSGLAILAISDHKLIIFDFTLICPAKCTDNITISYRRVNAVDISTFSASVASSAVPEVLNFTCPSMIYDMYHSLIANILDEYAPIRTRSVPMSHSSPWFNAELRAMKAKCRQHERIFRKMGLTVHYLVYSDYIKNYKTALNAARSSYISSIINKAKNRPKALFSMVNKLIQAPNHSISQHESDDLCCTFLHHFQGKLYVLCGTFGEKPTISNCEQTRSTQSLTTFTLTNPSLIADLKSNSSSSRRDPAPTFLLKHCTPVISAPISHLINMSFISSTVPISLKTAAVTPILKKKQIWIL